MKKNIISQKLSKYFDNYQTQKIIEKITGLTKNQLFFCDDIEGFDEDILEKYIKYWEKKYPFEYIINQAEFYWEEFYVDENVLIPRNDTEVMVDKVLDLLSKQNIPGPVLIDIWTGSSCIPISVLKNTQNILECHVVDISKNALEISKKNIKKHELENKIFQHHGSLLEPLENKIFENKNIIITANLPYIKNNDFKNMSEQTVLFEPDLALYWGPVTGFELYESLLDQMQELKNTYNLEINAFIEIGFDQKEYAQKYLKNLWKHFIIHSDNSGIARCIHIKI